VGLRKMYKPKVVEYNGNESHSPCLTNRLQLHGFVDAVEICCMIVPDNQGSTDMLEMVIIELDGIWLLTIPVKKFRCLRDGAMARCKYQDRN